jgi:hypothetical protein
MNWRWPVAGLTAHPVAVNSAEVSNVDPITRAWTRFRILVMSLFPYLDTSCLDTSYLEYSLNIRRKYVEVVREREVLSS